MSPTLPVIHLLRRHRVVLDADLARLYEVPTHRLNEAVKRNRSRFPEDFLFQINREELTNLISQNAISSSGYGGVRKLPWAFTEHGALMAATVLKSPRAVQMSLYLVRAFVRIREEIATGSVILKRLAEVDRHLLEHDVVLRDIYEKLQPLLTPPDVPPQRRIGFYPSNE